ncbi:hypothetical protein BAUCODRAFT_75511 [Baudoinia panamericana UAMH 10762]|uniref:Mob1/phocein n=1 Tax=Baudoinia panamericana (strain UAMH 10762) TaxID=717646 RepID=M2MP95_BAUPA|nr:uncharacterized protein BAUCODRAFT_75511 [Baudoinia panamericana UAMH 10762]EMC93293.1 hypothetical protein BAUCODRAFT_75511 [Baudoinia panamericana UAMH 10762]
MAAHSPASSPRLPSPPPIAEDQLGPASPGVALFEEHGKFPGNAVDHGASRRIRPGTKAEEMAEGPPLVDMSEIDSAFQLTEHLKALHYYHSHPPDTSTTQPITATIARQLAQPPPNTSKEIWLYELGRFLIQKTNAIIVALFADTPPCSPATCLEMRASEWQYLCAVHDPPKNCSAIDYCCHTLDWAATTLTSSKMFPSRLALGSGSAAAGTVDKMLQQQLKEITNIFRRVYRIYAHAWFQHRDMFWRVESKSGLYVFFKAVCDEYGLIQAENYTIPAEAEGLEPAEPSQDEEQERDKAPIEGPTILRRDDSEPHMEEPAGNHVVAAGETTKRHRHPPSERSSSVSTVIQEEAEEEAETEGPLEKPDLARQSMKMREIAEKDERTDAEKKEEAEQEGSSEERMPALGIRRSDTVKPERQASEEISVEPELLEEEEAVMSPASEKKELLLDDELSEAGKPKVAVMEPTEAAAADAEEAGKTVAD